MVDHLSRDQAYELLTDAQERRQKAIDAGDVAGQIEAARDCGIGHFYMGQTRLAIRLFDEARRLIDETGKRRACLPVVVGMSGRALQRSRRQDDALEHYRQAASIAGELDLAAQHLLWRGKEARTLIDAGRLDEGVPELEASVEYGRTLAAAGDPEVAAELARQLASLAAVVEPKDRRRSEALWREAFEHLEDLPPSRWHYLAATNYAVSLFQWGKEHQAQTYLEEALEIGRRIGADAEELLSMAHRLAEALARLYGFKTAGDWLSRRRHSHPGKQWEVLQHAVDLYERGFFWADMKRAVVEWRELPIPTPVSPSLYQIAMRRSFACRGLGEPDEALAALEEAGEHAQKWGQPEAVQAVRGQSVLVLVDRGDFREAVSRARELWEEGARDRLLARAFLSALIGTGEMERAAEVRAEFARGGGGALDAAWMAARLAEAGAGDPRQAWYDYGRLAREERETECELEALNALIELYPAGSEEKLEASRQRLRLFDKARSKIEDIFSDSAWLSVTPRAADLPAYLDAYLETAFALRRNEEAVYELERFRSQMLIDLLAERSARWRPDAPAGLQTRSYLTNEHDRARYRYRGLLAMRSGWRRRREAARELDRLNETRAGAGGILHVAPGWQGLHFPQSGEELFAGLELRQGEALLFQHVFAERTAFWLMDADGSVHEKAVPGFSSEHLAGLNEELRSYRDDEPAPEDAVAALSRLEETLARPLAKWLATFAVERVFLVAGTAGAILPLPACPSLARGKVDVAVLPTSRALAFARQTRTPPVEVFHPVNLFEHANDFAAARDRIVTLVDPTGSLAWAPLEAAAVRSAVGDRAVELVGREGVELERLGRRVRVADVLHLIVHGAFDDASPYLSGVYVNGPDEGDRLWTIADVYSELDAPVARLAVLSGCETGLSRPNLVSEEVSLPSALIAAGFAAVVASKWSVDDLSTALLMDGFYRRWYAGGVGVSRALSESVRWLQDLGREEAVAAIERLASPAADVLPRDEAAEWQALHAEDVEDLRAGPERPFGSPYYWAAFFVAGDGTITSDGVDRREPLADGDA